MFDKLEDLLRHYEELMNTLSEPDVANDANRFCSFSKKATALLFRAMFTAEHSAFSIKFLKILVWNIRLKIRPI